VGKIYDVGTDAPIVVIPGVQGRWEWMRPALRALAAHCRTISYSLGGRTFDELVAEVDAALDARQIETAAICGVSFGGMVAVRYAALRPERVTAVVIVSTPSPSWQPSAAQARYIAGPWRSTPAFVATAPARLWPEIAAAVQGWPGRIAFCAGHAARIAMAPIVPAQMAARIKLRDEVDLHADCARVKAPALIVSGEPSLDRVVPVESTRDYVGLIPGAKYAMMDRTGHLGLLTQPARFARIVSEFIHASRP